MSGSIHAISKADIHLSETDGCADGADDGSNGGRDLISADMLPLVAFSDAGDGRLASGAIASKICHSAKHGHHWTPLGMAGPPVPDQLAFDAVFLRRI